MQTTLPQKSVLDQEKSDGCEARGYRSALEYILSEVPVETFKREYLGRKCLHIPGHANKLSHLLRWSEVKSNP
jgi:hypothetical protein